MSVYTEAELAYLRGERRLAHVATVGARRHPPRHPGRQVERRPRERGRREVTGHTFAATKKFRDVARSGRAAIVVDDVVYLAARGYPLRRPPADAVDAPQPLSRRSTRSIVAWSMRAPAPVN